MFLIIYAFIIILLMEENFSCGVDKECFKRPDQRFKFYIKKKLKGNNALYLDNTLEFQSYRKGSFKFIFYGYERADGKFSGNVKIDKTNKQICIDTNKNPIFIQTNNCQDKIIMNIEDKNFMIDGQNSEYKFETVNNILSGVKLYYKTFYKNKNGIQLKLQFINTFSKGFNNPEYAVYKYIKKWEPINGVKIENLDNSKIYTVNFIYNPNKHLTLHISINPRASQNNEIKFSQSFIFGKFECIGKVDKIKRVGKDGDIIKINKNGVEEKFKCVNSYWQHIHEVTQNSTNITKRNSSVSTNTIKTGGFLGSKIDQTSFQSENVTTLTNKHSITNTDVKSHSRSNKKTVLTNNTTNIRSTCSDRTTSKTNISVTYKYMDTTNTLRTTKITSNISKTTFSNEITNTSIKTKNEEIVHSTNSNKIKSSTITNNTKKIKNINKALTVTNPHKHITNNIKKTSFQTKSTPSENITTLISKHSITNNPVTTHSGSNTKKITISDNINGIIDKKISKKSSKYFTEEIIKTTIYQSNKDVNTAKSTSKKFTYISYLTTLFKHNRLQENQITNTPHLMCPFNQILINGACYSCGQNMIINKKYNTCICKNTFKKNKKGVCIKICLPDEYPENNICKKCKSPFKIVNKEKNGCKNNSKVINIIISISVCVILLVCGIVGGIFIYRHYFRWKNEIPLSTSIDKDISVYILKDEFMPNNESKDNLTQNNRNRLSPKGRKNDKNLSVIKKGYEKRKKKIIDKNIHQLENNDDNIETKECYNDYNNQKKCASNSEKTTVDYELEKSEPLDHENCPIKNNLNNSKENNNETEYESENESESENEDIDM